MSGKVPTPEDAPAQPSLDRAARAAARRCHLLETARALFVAQGFHRTGVAQIAAASGVKVGQIYRDFANKEAIIAAIAEHDVTDWLEEDALAAAVTAGDTRAIRAWIGRFDKSTKLESECQMMTEVLAESARSPRIAEIYRALDERVRGSLVAALEALAPAGRGSHEIAMLAEFILATGFGIVARRVVNPQLQAAPLRDFVSLLIDHELAAITEAAARPRLRCV